MADLAVPDLDMAFGYYMAVPTSADKSGVQFHCLQWQRADVAARAYRDPTESPF